MPKLIFRIGGEPLIEYRLRPGRTTIGRADTCDVSLPGTEISRTHCIIDGRDDGWSIVDRSRHGVKVDGVSIEDRAPLRDGANVSIGPYQVEVRLSADAVGPTSEAVPDQGFERILAADQGVLVERARLRVVAGPDAGAEWVLQKPRITLGAAPSDIELKDAALVAGHTRLRVAMGRVMVEPGNGAAFIEGQRIRELTPLRVGEELRVGETLVRVDMGEVEEQALANHFGEMVGDSAPMKHVFGLLRRMAGHHAPVLIIGESGTGKELAARAVHDASPRSAARYVPINCGAIATNLFESELFGHEKGAFTGAMAQKDGAFHAADGGTLFLDEVGELPEDAQAKLLRALETGEVRRVGSLDVTYPDVRVVAATNRDLVSQVQAGLFREDLFFRLAVLTVHIPPLRERPEDVPLICEKLLKGLHPEALLTPDALAVLLKHDWPGNVRELRNVLQRAIVVGGPRITPQHLTFHNLGRSGLAPAQGSLADAEKSYIESVLRKHAGNRSAAARELGLARSSLHYKLSKLGIS